MPHLTIAVRTSLALLTVALSSSAVAACGPSSDAACTPGAQQACACRGGAQGVQVCDPAGAAYGACDCPDAPDVGAGGGAGGDLDLGESGYGAAAADVEASGGAGCVGPTSPLHLSIPWIPQVPPGTWGSTRNCGPTSYAMVDAYFHGTSPDADSIRAIDDGLSAAFPSTWSKNGYNGSNTTIDQLATLAKSYGTYAKAKAFHGGCDDLKSELAQNRPVIVAVDTQTRNDWPSTRMVANGHGHFMVVGGMDTQYVYLFDPGRSAPKNGCGADDAASCTGRKYTLESFDAVWAKHGRAGVFIQRDATDACSCGDGVCDRSSACGESCAGCEIDCGACAKACPNACSGHGTCDGSTGACSCAGGYTGADCSTAPTKPCPNACSGHGSCDAATGTCGCSGGYSGVDCSVAPAVVCKVSASRTDTGGTANAACTCSSSLPGCHALYGGHLAGTSTGSNGPRATVTYSKLGGGTMSAGTRYWIETVAPSVTPACTELGIYADRMSGTFGTTSTSQTITFDVWPSQASYDAAASGDTKCLFLVTDGAGSVGTKTWFEPEKLCFTKTCS